MEVRLRENLNWYHIIILISIRCDGEDDCGDNSDEEGCKPTMDGPCKYNEFQCANGQCILKSFQCDSQKDCQDNSDEIGCSKFFLEILDFL